MGKAWRMVGYGENLGSGFPLILDAWKQAEWSVPELKNKIDLDEVELVFTWKSRTRLKRAARNCTNWRDLNCAGSIRTIPLLVV